MPQHCQTAAERRTIGMTHIDKHEYYLLYHEDKDKGNKEAEYELKTGKHV